MVIFMNEKNNLTSIDCAAFLGLTLIGESIKVHQVAKLGFKGCGAVIFVSTFDEVYVDDLNKAVGNFVIAHQRYSGLLKLPHVISDNPRLDFCRLSKRFFPKTISYGIEKSTVIGDNVLLGHSVYLGHNVIIENNVKIGDYTTIMHNVVISEGSEIGTHCVIKSGSVIGQKGFGFVRDEEGIPIEFTHYGKVIIGNHVEIGALNTVVTGALSDTIIEDYVKTDDHVHIAHNVVIGRGSFITACAEISGSVRIGKQVWLGPNCSVIDSVTLGDQVFVGIGAVVTKSFSEGAVIAGNPGKKLMVSKVES
jgi:UDP-3-O-[3-hydroxymyristoyl] glucosamine N-acyltransferase LpxD